MSKEIVVQVWCDGEHVMKQPANREQEISLRPGKRYTVDLCEACYSSVVRPLEALVHEHGVPVPQSGKNASPYKTNRQPGNGPHKCNQCPHGASSRSALGQHLKKVHGMTIAMAGV